MADAVASTPPAPGAAIAETPPAGLTSAQVAERRSRGLANAGGERTSRSVAEILRANILTRFNFILGVLLAVILVAGQRQRCQRRSRRMWLELQRASAATKSWNQAQALPESCFVRSPSVRGLRVSLSRNWRAKKPTWRNQLQLSRSASTGSALAARLAGRAEARIAISSIVTIVPA